jgi:hypothetical protein
MSAADLTKPQPKSVFYDRTDPALMISTGNPPAPGRNYPQRLNFFRAKPGADGRWSGAARAFNEFYGCTIDDAGNAKTGPKQLVIRFPSDVVADVLDVRFLAFAQGRLAAKGDTNYAAVEPWQHHAPEMITAYPIEGDPVRFQIAGADDPLCQGGQYDIPVDQVKGKPSGKPTLIIRATLSFTLAEIGALSAVTQYQTSSISIRSGLWKSLNQFATLGPLSSWLFLLRGVPGRRRYKDDAGKSHSTETWDVQLWGPIHGLDRHEAITIADAQLMADRSRELQASRAPLLGPGTPATSPPPVLGPGSWADDDTEPVTGEVVEPAEPENPDDRIEF